MYSDLHKVTKIRHSYKEIFLIIIDDQSDGSIKIFPLINYGISGNSQPQVTVLLPFFSNISALQAVQRPSLRILALIHELLGLFLLH